MKILENTNLVDKTVLLIVDYNVPIVDGKVTSEFKIEQTYDTIKYILEKKPSLLVISSHLGRPKSRDQYSTRDIIPVLQKFHKAIAYCEIRVFNIKVCQENCSASQVLLTDNGRYYGEEELVAFYKTFDVVVNDAFGAAHRKSIHPAIAGLLMRKELEKLSVAKKVDFIILGGAKLETKIKFIESFKSRIFIGGFLAPVVHQAMGYNIRIPDFTVPESVKTFVQNAKNIVLPVDYLVKTKDGSYLNKRLEDLDINETCLDIGEQSWEMLQNEVDSFKSIFWNGPMGYIEDARADKTAALARYLNDANAQIYAGGGETAAVIMASVNNINYEHISTGGGAMMQFLSGGDMPGIAKLL
ncbi:phosphoglycerate kinase [Enteropsectra breve]|nr:phosphoglycerate kinase [Enteropsectra breve]